MVLSNAIVRLAKPDFPFSYPLIMITLPFRKHIWIVDDDKSIRWVLEKALQKAGMSTRSFSNGEDLLKALQQNSPDVLLTDIRMPGMNGLQLTQAIHNQHPELPVIIMTAHSDLDSAVSAFHHGAFEYLPKPFDIQQVVEKVKMAYATRQPEPVDNNLNQPPSTQEIIGESPAMQDVFRAIGRLARSHITVLINGESGTGKELVAQALHRHSPRAEQPFIALNMAAIPKDLMESELFGHEKGAFTGAHSRRTGRFEQANGGTLFLDEIGDMSIELQTRLLRVLSDHEFYPVGAHSAIKVDVRIIAATHQNLEKLVAEGRFREDLFHRLNVIRIRIPPLRERSQDIGLLMRHFLQKSAQELHAEKKLLDKEAETFLQTLDWPGNVRQLENLCRWLTVMTPGHHINIQDLPTELKSPSPTTKNPLPVNTTDWQQAFESWVMDALASGQPEVAKQAIPMAEAILIKAALRQTHGKKHEAAKLLGYGRNTLSRKIKELNIPVE
jgi:two-component system nitrogen regulation response regulator GlnG